MGETTFEAKRATGVDGEAPLRDTARTLVTVVITVYNRLQYLPQAIESVLGQTHTNVEVIVVLDGALVDPRPVVARYGERVQLLRRPNGGMAAARNTGIAAARGEFILFLDDDDRLELEGIEALLKAIAENPGAAWAAGRLRYTFEETGATEPGRPWLHFTSGDIYERMIRENLISCPSAAMVRIDALRAVGMFDEEIRMSDDHDLWLKLARDYPVAATPATITNYRVHAHQCSRTDWDRHYDANLLVLEKRQPFARPGTERVFDEARADVHFQFGDTLDEKGDPAGARRQWRMALATRSPRKKARILLRLAKSHLPRGLRNLRARSRPRRLSPA